MGIPGTHRLLVVERSASMRQVLATFLTSRGFEPVLIDDYNAALACLAARFEVPGERIDAVLLGWPTVMEPDAESCLQALATGDHTDLPIVILSTDMRAETRAWTSSRPNAILLGWKDYQRSHAALDDLLRSPVDPEIAASVYQQPLSLLLVDDDESSRTATTTLWADRGYAVQTATHSARAIEMARGVPIDIVLIDFQWNAQRGDALCRLLVDDPLCQQGAVVMLLDHPIGHQIARCLQAGAVECFYRSESNRLQLARIDALGRLLRRDRSVSSSEFSSAASPTTVESDQHPEPVGSGKAVLAGIARRAGWNASAIPVLAAIETQRSHGIDGAKHCLLMLLETREDAAATAAQSLAGKVSSVAAVTPRRLLLILDAPVGHAGYQQARRIMQQVNALGEAHDEGKASSIAAVIAPSLNPDRNLVQLLASLIKAVDVNSGQATDRALLLDIKRYLPVYPPG